MPVMAPVTTATLVGGPTALLRRAGLAIITDPTFDGPGDYANLTRTAPPALQPADLGPIDVALVSHHHHPDNLDGSGRALLAQIPTVVTTVAGAEALAGDGIESTGLAPWQSLTIHRPDAPLTITATPALHGPPGVAEHTGPVIGFIVESPGAPTIYFSGDNSEVDVVRQIAVRFPSIDIALLCVGAARVANRGPDPLTLDAARATRVGALWPAAAVVPVHADSWAHFSEPRDQFVANWTGPADQLIMLEPGVETALD